jgi:hypothetical protein
VVRQLLDKEDMENMRDGFFTGTLNKRGVTSRSMYEGGGQEIDLANKFDALSKKVEISEPFVAETLKRIANSYHYDADQEYQKALLRQEY